MKHEQVFTLWGIDITLKQANTDSVDALRQPLTHGSSQKQPDGAVPSSIHDSVLQAPPLGRQWPWQGRRATAPLNTIIVGSPSAIALARPSLSSPPPASCSGGPGPILPYPLLNVPDLQGQNSQRGYCFWVQRRIRGNRGE